MHKSIKAVIPAHLASNRLAEKVLVDIKGKPMLLRVLEQCAKVLGKENVHVATPDKKIADLAQSWGYTPYISQAGLKNGTAAIASIIHQLEADFVINVQADQPLVPTDLIETLIAKRLESDAHIVTPVYRIKLVEDIEDVGVAKVVRTLKGFALYFSRSPIPYVRNTPVSEWPEKLPYWGHYGLYAYRRDVLENHHSLEDSYLANGERLEQLGFLQNGLIIFTFETSHRQLAVDTPEDLEKILKYIN